MSSNHVVADELPAEHRAKFDPDGAPRSFYGATVICHLRDSEANHRVFSHAMTEHLPDLTAVHASGSTSQSAYVKLPAPSFHMTIFDTKVYHEWRMAVPAGTTPQSLLNSDMAEIFRPRFAAIRPQLSALLPVIMQIDLDVARQAKRGKTLVIPLVVSNPDSKHKLQRIREMLCISFGVPRPANMESFGFHLTVYYPVNVLSTEDFEVVRSEWTDGLEGIARNIEELVIDRIELCSFENMCHFEVVDSVRVQ